MSTNFSSNQFNSAFLPCHLQNYAIPRKFKEFPGQRRTCTTVIANNRGHILPQYHNRRSKSAWGHFMGTWQQPKKPVNVRIKTKLMAHGLSGLPQGFGTSGIALIDLEKNEHKIDVTSREEANFLPSSSSNESGLVRTNSRESTRSDKTPVADSPLPPPGSSQLPSRTSSAASRSAASRSSSACSIHSSAGCTPYTQGLPGSSSVSEHPSSSLREQQTTTHVKLSSSAASQTNSSSKPMSGGSTRVSSAPVQTRSNSLSKTGSSQSQRTTSRLHSSMSSEQHSRPNSSQQSIVSVLEEADNEGPTSYSNSRATSRASIASTTSTRSGVKCRGVQCSPSGTGKN